MLGNNHAIAIGDEPGQEESGLKWNGAEKNYDMDQIVQLTNIKSMAKMIRLFYPEHKDVANTILSIPQKRESKPLVDFFNSG